MPRRGAALVALTICLLPVGPGAHADELLVMPYACTVSGGRTVLRPGPEQSHRIIGQREQRRFSACSPVNPTLCRQWTVYRFDLDCDGQRVPWVALVAAAGEWDRRARLVDGRLQLRMAPSWSLEPDDPCAREADLDGRFASGRLRRYCADRLALAPPPVVEMPLGFAPMLGIDAIFVKEMPGIGTAPPALPPARAAELPRQAELDGIPSSPPVVKEAPAKPPASPEVAAQPKAAPAPDAPPKVASRPEPTAGDRPAPEAPKKTAPPDPRPAVSPEAPPKVASRPEPTAGDRPVPEAPKKTAPPDPKPAPQTAAAPPAEPKQVAPPAEATPEDTAASINLLTVFRTTTTGAIVAFAGLALGLLTAFALARRRGRHAGGRPRAIASAALDAKPARPPARLGYARGRVPPNAAASAMGRVPGAPARSPLADWGHGMPETRAEALQVLGIGVTPSANVTAIKKIVDGLRLSWHPDLAEDEADRQLRELRSKQINAAWELLQGQRAEA